MGMKKEKDRGTDRAIATSAVTPTCNHFPVFFKPWKLMWNKHQGLLRLHALATPLRLKADVKVSVLSGEGEGARVSVNTSWVLFHPGVKLVGLQGGESWVLTLSTASCDGWSAHVPWS